MLNATSTPIGSLLRKMAGALLAALILAVAAAVSPALAQHQVAGVVTDADDGESLPGVNIVVKGTNTGTATRSNGAYSLTAPSPTDTLILSFIGEHVLGMPRSF